MHRPGYASMPHTRGLLDVGTGQHVYWEESGNPNGSAALVLHGGPGSGFSPAFRNYFDPQLYRLIMFDQRGCGRSTPHASDPAADMAPNTTAALLDDIEKLREHLQVRSWVLYGVSWGATLALAYALRHRDQVSAIVLSSVTTTRKSEIEWLYGGLRLFFPSEHYDFAGSVGMLSSDNTFAILQEYDLRLNDPNHHCSQRASQDWHKWEDATVSLEDGVGSHAYTGSRTPAQLYARARICAHYFSRHAFLADDEILARGQELTGIPGTLIHGRFDISSPIDTAWRLADAWPDAKLVVTASGHIAAGETAAAITTALDSHTGAG
ncbi:MAG: prolyl aminopeptidase [Gordonia sp.]|nr:prolyl aminopeptidase [Gordonia sp. (in: high G+C Gram-positive bacteria)]